MAAQRAAQIAGHLNYPRGLLAGQVAIITGSGQGIDISLCIMSLRLTPAKESVPKQHDYSQMRAPVSWCKILMLVSEIGNRYLSSMPGKSFY